NRGTDKSIYGNYTSLFSNFCFETVEPSTDINERTEQYNNQKTYCLTDYNIFHILKSYYLSFWNKDKYMKYLGELNKTNDNLRISGIIDFYDKNIVVIDFFEFWNRLTQYGIDYIFDENLFKKLYGWNVYKTKTKSADEISTLKGEVTPLIKNSLTTLKDNMDDNKDAFGNVIWNKESFKEIFEHEKTGLFKDYFLRDKIE
ncbi:MAG: hypothetical protein LBD21_09860, partial [Tannerellaceae bacterium]|nr:hypothetical protein [Tannerellaceae bacterium]